MSLIYSLNHYFTIFSEIYPAIFVLQHVLSVKILRCMQERILFANLCTDIQLYGNDILSVFKMLFQQCCENLQRHFKALDF